VVASGVVVRGAHGPVFPLAVPAIRMTVANVPPFVPDEALVEELAKHGKVVSPLRKTSSGCKSPLLRHVVSHRRQTHMVLTKAQALSLVIKRIEGFDYVMFATSDDGRCFRCGGEGHLARVCPERNPSTRDQNRGEAREEKGKGEDRRVGLVGGSPLRDGALPSASP
uniref:CCHC-type domain-containing protein n=1 Tax=Gasterosteus aculeatus TaxID=69293 RepID=G3Q9K5_GASAC